MRDLVRLSGESQEEPGGVSAQEFQDQGSPGGVSRGVPGLAEPLAFPSSSTFPAGWQYTSRVSSVCFLVPTLKEIRL